MNNRPILRLEQAPVIGGLLARSADILTVWWYKCPLAFGFTFLALCVQ